MLPNLIIIGAQKCGTTSLHYYLSLHPEISMSWEKELNFFVLERNWPKGIGWYQSHFDRNAKVRGESSPNYTFYPRFQGVAERMHGVIPQAKLIYLVRDPVERLISHYIHGYAEGWENRTLPEALTDLDTCHYVQRSRYFMQLEQYLKFFPLSRILVIAQEDLYDRRRETVRRVFRFLDVDDSFDSGKFARLMHRSSKKRRKSEIGMLISGMPGLHLLGRLPGNFSGRDLRLGSQRALFWLFSRRIQRPVVQDSLRQRLADYFRKDMERLRELTGQPLKGWCV